jgi:hypothetical protein
MFVSVFALQTMFRLLRNVPSVSPSGGKGDWPIDLRYSLLTDGFIWNDLLFPFCVCNSLVQVKSNIVKTSLYGN